MTIKEGEGDLDFVEDSVAPILNLVDSNGHLEFEITNSNSTSKYELNIQKNSSDKIRKVTITDANSIIVDQEVNVGVYAYYVTTKSDAGDELKSNSINYVVTESGSGAIGPDTDLDGLEDLVEDEIGSDKENPDTDGDGLPDGYEYYILGTDVLKKDTDDNGINDGDEDFDGDTLNNLKEYQIGTSPNNPDTDGDILDDNKELELKTDPLKADTDGDTLTDSDDILLGFDPLKKDTNGNGILDCDEKVKQEVSKNNMNKNLLKDNMAIPELSVVTTGNVNKHIAILEYDKLRFGGSRSLIGKGIEIKGAFDTGELAFSIDKSINSIFKFDDKEFNKLSIVHYNDKGEVEYLDTEYDKAKNKIKTSIKGEGIYYVLDVERLFNELGVTLQNKSGLKAIHSDAKVKGQADIAFVIDTTGSMGDEINNVKNNINVFVDELKSRGIVPNLALIDYQDIEVDGIDSTTVHRHENNNWFIDMEAYKKTISSLGLGYGGDEPECAVDALETGRLLDLRENANKFFILVTDAGFKVANRYDIPSMEYEIDLLKNSGISTSVVAPTSKKSAYNDLFTKTDGIFANIYGDFYKELMIIADKIGDDVVDTGKWVYLNGPVPVKLKEMPKKGSKVDTDGDGITDVDELVSEKPTGKLDLDKLITEVSNGIITGTNYGIVESYDYKSNPAVVDTDKDGNDDESDLDPIKPFKTPVILLHGRTDNTGDCFGAITKISPNNEHYNSDTDKKGNIYTDFKNHLINPEDEAITKGDGGGKTPSNIAYELQIEGYQRNENLLAFNYPNRDMTNLNAKKFDGYMDSLAEYMSKNENGNKFYPTKEAKVKKEISVNLIGHSNGGLVSRFYIENLGKSDNVKKLITIDTPHWGSGFADVSEHLPVLGHPIDADLNPDNAIFGGTEKTYFTFNPYLKEQAKYMTHNQTKELKYTNQGNTEYYFLSGYDLKTSKVPNEYKDGNIAFDIEENNISNFKEYENNLKYSFTKNTKYPSLSNDLKFMEVFDLKSSYGDNVVNNQSQLGLFFEDDKPTSTVIKQIKHEKSWMNMDTFKWHNVAFHFHGQNQKRLETIDKVLEYLKE